MNQSSGEKSNSSHRIPTGIGGFDAVLKGGFLRGGVYLLMGPPGSGKTIIANQMSFSHAAAGGHAVYATLLAEAHGRMLGNLRDLDFFKEDAVSNSINYIGAYQVLEKEGLDGLLRMLRETVRKFKASLLFIDGIASAEEIANSPLAFKKFVHQLNSVLSTSGCTTFLLSSLDGSVTNPEHTMVDGIISLMMPSGKMRTVREIEVKKFRGSDHLLGAHYFRISNEGVRIYPRIESYLGQPTLSIRENAERRCFDIRKLDSMLGGGLVSGSTTSLLGPAGSGKTVLGSHFLAAGAQRGEPSLYFGLYEAPARLMAKMDRMGLGFSRHVKKGALEVVWWPRIEHVIDELLEEILVKVQKSKIKRVFIDGVGGIQTGLFSPERMHRAMAALANELRALDATTLFAEETEIFPRELSATLSDLSAVTDNILLIRQVEIDSELRRFLSVLKTRESRSDRKIHEVTLSDKGFHVGDVFSNVQALITGTPIVKSKAKAKRRK